MSQQNYNELMNKSNDYYTSKILNNIHSGASDNGLRLLRLTELIPNWETYLTPKQLESAKIYIKCLNASEVDYQLNLSVGTTQQRLFGSSTSKGAIGKLETIVKRLEKHGYFDKKKKNKINKNKKNKKKSSRLTKKTKIQIKELIKLVVDMPEYEEYLTNSQKERVYQFLRLRSINKCAKHFGITKTTFKQSLLGRGGKGGILGRLKTAYNEKTVDNWDEI